MNTCYKMMFLLSFFQYLLPNTPQTVELTVFIHGGGLHPVYFFVSDFFSVLNEKIDKSLYARTTLLMRDDPFFFQAQPMDYMGMQRAYPTKNIQLGSHIFGKFYDRIYRMATHTKHKTLYYAFGWEALLSPAIRRNAGHRLYLELAAKSEQIRRFGYKPYIRVIGYSHGGNVALNMGEYARNYPTSFLSIDELILISTPIQPRIKDHAFSKIFKSIYLFYSVGDRIQSTDFLSSPRHIFSQRTLPKQKNCSPYCKITQVQVRIANRVVPTKNIKGNNKNISNKQMLNPNHTEMFFFGWTPEWYRSYFPLRPLSVGLITPIIMSALEKLHLHGHHVRVSIIPYQERMSILDRDTDKTYTVPFITLKELQALQRDLWRYKPRGFKSDDQFKTFYRNRMKEALKKARAQSKDQRKHGCVTCSSRAKRRVASAEKARRLHSA